jgi:hypothetical protein
VKTLGSPLLILVLVISGFALGTWIGYTQADSDILCGGFGDYRLLDDFKDPKGLFLPKGTIVKARECKGNIHLEMGLIIEKWDFPLVEYIGANKTSDLIYLTSQKTLNEDGRNRKVN